MACDFEPQGFLDFSKFLQSVISCPDATKRSAISRAYYSAFLTARERIDILARGLMNHNKKMHTEVIIALKNRRFKHQDNTLWRDLRRLKRYRVDADYKFDNAEESNERNMSSNPHDIRIVNRTIQMAERIIFRINRLS